VARDKSNCEILLLGFLTTAAQERISCDLSVDCRTTHAGKNSWHQRPRNFTVSTVTACSQIAAGYSGAVWETGELPFCAGWPCGAEDEEESKRKASESS
jgi:hypothetical protein